jgi:tRNA pseudouridine-54 N-methylase
VNTTAKEVIVVSIVIMPEGTLVVMKKDTEENLERKETAMIVVEDENANVITGTIPERNLLMTKGEGGTVLKKENRNAVLSTKMRESVIEEKTVASASINIISVGPISLFLQNVDRVFCRNRRTS